MDVLGALVVAALKNLAGVSNAAAFEKPAEALPAQTVHEEKSQPVSTAYPPDAVITTTTTVDTTKNAVKQISAEQINRETRTEKDSRESFFDIDGFYDKYE